MKHNSLNYKEMSKLLYMTEHMGLSLACVTWNQPDEKQFAQK